MVNYKRFWDEIERNYKAHKAKTDLGIIEQSRDELAKEWVDYNSGFIDAVNFMTSWLDAQGVKAPNGRPASLVFYDEYLPEEENAQKYA